MNFLYKESKSKFKKIIILFWYGGGGARVSEFILLRFQI